MGTIKKSRDSQIDKDMQIIIASIFLMIKCLMIILAEGLHMRFKYHWIRSLTGVACSRVESTLLFLPLPPSPTEEGSSRPKITRSGRFS